ncbi:MAG TPA: hypothetical protein VNS63_04945 [Blastocatellia bacterium]|nr:hypothetical protein [Blastocatellia bacterium]
MNRRAFLEVSGRTMTFALAAGAARTERLTALEYPQTSPDGLEERVAAVIQMYDAQGNHRTGTEVDKASAEWLANQVRNLGAELSLEPFTLNRVDPQLCYLRIGDRRIEGVPLFDAGFTAVEGVRGRIGPIGSDAEIGLAETTPFMLTEPIGIDERNQVAEARHSRHKAGVLLTRGSRPGLFLINASAFTKPFGPPMLQVSSVESEWLKEQAQRRAETTVAAHAKRTVARAFNITAKIAGKNPRLAPIVLMAPRSGWWQCASEQGSRLVCWLEAMRVLAAGKPARDCFFVALSGHELGFLGMDAYLKSRPGLIKRAHAWIFFGSSIGEPRQPNLIHASDDALEQWAVAAMDKEDLTANGKAQHGSKARGEAGAVQQGGGRYFTLVCGSNVYHNVADRWPEAVDVAILARYARAFANGALELAQQS